MSKELTAVSLFTGAGGMDVGVERAGIKVVFANELMKEAAQTYNANHPWLPLHSRNRNPCQPMCEWASSTAISRARCRSTTTGS